jgi:hypothetical protein
MFLDLFPFVSNKNIFILIDNMSRELHFFFRNGVLPASASIDAHSHFIKEVQEFYKYHTPKR